MRDVARDVLRRVFILRQLPGFSGVDVDELATVAQNMADVDLAPGDVLAAPGERPAAVHVLVDGLAPARVFGALEVLASQPATTHTVLRQPTPALRLNADDLDDVLDDNFDVLVAVLRALAGALAAVPRGAVPLVSRSAAAVARSEQHRSALPPAENQLGPRRAVGLVDRLLLLRGQAPLAHARVHALAALANASRELLFPAGAALTVANDPAREAYIVASGVAATSERRIAAGESFALLETIAGESYPAALTALTPVRALATSSTALFDVLEDHSDLGLDLVAALARGLLER